MANETVVRTKVCTKCGVEKPATLAVFPPHKMGKFGLHPYCRPCKKADDAEMRARPDQKARQQAWRNLNKDYTKRYNRKYREAYKSTDDVAAWRAKNIDHAREQERRRMRERRASDPAFLLKARLSARLASMLRDKNGRCTESLLGYTRRELKAHIERQFTKGMTWEALLRGEIHIDHIIPVSAFNITSADDPDFRACWGLPNLRPMWARDNLAKGSRRLTLL